MICNDNKILVFNYREAKSKAFYRYSKYYINIYKPFVYVVLEMRSNPNKIQKSLMLLRFDEYIMMENQGFAGGRGMAWKKKHLTVNLCKKDTQHMCLHIQTHAGSRWFFTTIYASPNNLNKSGL